MKKVVIDTGPLLAFAKAGIVDALKNLFKQLIITGEVYIEVFSKKSPENNSIKENIGKFIQVHGLHELIRIDDKKIKETVQMLDDGEKSSILLSHVLIKDKNQVLMNSKPMGEKGDNRENLQPSRLHLLNFPYGHLPLFLRGSYPLLRKDGSLAPALVFYYAAVKIHWI